MVGPPVEDTEGQNHPPTTTPTKDNDDITMQTEVEDWQQLETSIIDNTTTVSNMEMMETETKTERIERQTNDNTEDEDFMMSFDLNEKDLQMMQEKEKFHRARATIQAKQNIQMKSKNENTEEITTKKQARTGRNQPAMTEVINLLSQVANRKSGSSKPKITPNNVELTQSTQESPNSLFINTMEIHDLDINKRTFNLRVEFTTSEGVQQADKFFYDILNNMKEVDNNIVIYSNVTKTKTKLPPREEMEKIKDLFKVFSITTGDAPPKSAVICFRITTTSTMREIKTNAAISRILRENNIYLKIHHWDTEQWNPTLLCWRLLVHPDREVDTMVMEEFEERLEKSNEKWPKDIKLAISKGKHTFKDSEGIIHSTSAFNFQVLPQFKNKAMEIVQRLYKGDKCMVQASLKKENPTGYKNAICIQNSYINEFRSIKCTGFTEDVMFYLREKIFSIEGINSYTWKQNYDPYGTVYLNTNKGDFTVVGNCLLAAFPQWIEEISADALQTGYEDLPRCHYKAVSINREKQTKPVLRSTTKANSYNEEASVAYATLYKEIEKHFTPPKQKPNKTTYISASWASVVSLGSEKHQHNQNNISNTTTTQTTAYETPEKPHTQPNGAVNTSNSTSDEISTLTNEVELLKTDLKKLNHNIQDISTLKSDINELKTLKEDMTSIKEHHKKNESIQDELHSLKNTISSLVELTTHLTAQNQQFQASLQMMITNQVHQYHYKPPSKPPDEENGHKRTPVSPTDKAAKRIDSKTTPIRTSFIQSPMGEQSQIVSKDSEMTSNELMKSNPGSKVDRLEQVTKNLADTFHDSAHENIKKAPILVGHKVT